MHSWGYAMRISLTLLLAIGLVGLLWWARNADLESEEIGANGPQSVTCKEPKHGEDIEVAVARFVPPKHPHTTPTFGQNHQVTLEFCVSEEGRATEVTVTHSEPDKYFDAASIVAIGKWEFEPYRVDGEDMQVCECRSTFNFEYDE